MKKERIKVYLDKKRKDKKNGESYVFLTYTRKGQQFFYTQLKTKDEFWDEEEERIDLTKIKKKEDKEAALEINDSITELKRRIQRIADKIEFDVEPIAKLVKAKFQEEEEKETNRKNQEFNYREEIVEEEATQQEKEKTFQDHFQDFIKERTEFESVSGSTVKKYNTAFEHYKLFIHHRKFVPLYLDEITVKKFEEPYRHFMRFHYIQNSYINEDGKVIKPPKEKIKIGLAENSIVKDMKVFVTVMKHFIFEKELTKNKDYKNFDLDEYTSDNPPLPKEYFKILVNSSFPERPALQKVLDKFIVGAITSLRYEDLNGKVLKERVFITKDDLALSYIELRSGKGKKEKTEIYYVGEIGAKILLKYMEDEETGEFALPQISAKNFNEHLKEIGKLLGFDRMTAKETVKKNKTNTGKIKDTIIEKAPFYELMSSHMMRRTSVTFMKRSLDDRMTMKQSHHKTRENLDKYNKFADAELARAINNVFNSHAS